MLALADLDSSDEPEEQRRRYEAYLAAQNLKFVMDIIVKVLEKLHEIDERRAAQTFAAEVRNELEREVAEEKPAEPKPVSEPEQVEEQAEEETVQMDEQTM